MTAKKKSKAKVMAHQNQKERDLATLERAAVVANKGKLVSGAKSKESAATWYRWNHSIVMAVLKGRQDDYNAAEEISKGVKALARRIRAEAVR